MWKEGKADSTSQWHSQIADWKSELGAKGRHLNLAPWSSLPGLRLTGISSTTRVKAILDCVTMEILGGASKTAVLMADPAYPENIRQAMTGVYVDLSQNPVRRAFSNKSGDMKCQHTASIVYSFGRDSVVLPFEMLLLQGHNTNVVLPECMSLSELQDLAGMGIFLPNLAALMLGLWLQVDF